jgi:FAD synthetase
MKTVLTGGKFNHIHSGHVWLLKKAKKLGKLIVVLAHDKHNRREYAMAAKKRKRQIEALGLADKVVIGSSTGFVGTVKKVRPDIIVLGYDQRMPDKITEDYIKEKKIKVVRFKKHGNHSTRKLLQLE